MSPVRTFGIDKAYTRYKDPTSEFKRQNDIYVFCLNTGVTKEESNPMVLNNWRFWVVPTETINGLCGNQKRFSLGRLKKICAQPKGIGYADLKAAIDQYC